MVAAPAKRLLLILSFFLPALAIAAPLAEPLQEMRHLAFSACSNLLVYYNPNQGDHDPRYLERYQDDLRQLRLLVARAGAADIAASAADLDRHIADLQQQPASQSQLYPVWINPLLEAQARLDQQLASRYQAAPPVDPAILALHRQNLDIQRLQLLYQTRTFGGLAVYVLPVSETTFADLDQQVIGGFSALERLLPTAADELASLAHKYAFIRPRLLENERKWVPGSAAFYLGQVGDGLARLSEARVPASGG